MDAESGPAPRSDGPGNGRRPRSHIARGKYALKRRLLGGVRNDPLARGTLRHFIPEEAEIRLHAHGENHGVAGKGMFPAGNRDKRQASLFIETAFLHVEIVHAGDAVAVHADAGHRTAIMDMDTFAAGLFQILFRGAHGAFRLKAQHMHIGRAEAPGRERTVEGHPAAAHDHDRPAHVGTLAERGLAQKFHSLEAAFRVGYGQGVLFGRAGGDDNGIRGSTQFRERNVLAHGDVDTGADARFQYPADLAIHHVAGQAEIRDGVTGNPPKHGAGFVHGHLMPKQGQEIGRRHSGGPAAHHGDALARFRRTGKRFDALGRVIVDGAFQRPRVHAAFQTIPVALRLTEVGAHPPGHAGERVFGAQVAQRFTKTSLFHKGLHLLDRVSRRTGRLARRGAELIPKAVAHDDGLFDFSAISRGHRKLLGAQGAFDDIRASASPPGGNAP